MHRRTLILSTAAILALSFAGSVYWSSRAAGLETNEWMRLALQELDSVATFEQATNLYRSKKLTCYFGAFRYANGEWIAIAAVDGHSNYRAKDSIVVRDSRGRNQAFSGGHVCGHMWIHQFDPRSNNRCQSLDDVYALITDGSFLKCTLSKRN